MLYTIRLAMLLPYPARLSSVVEFLSCPATDIHRSLMPQTIEQLFPGGAFGSARHFHRLDLRHRFPMPSHHKTFALTDILEKTGKVATGFRGRYGFFASF